eukprot:8519675-Alexandrium_andersonii.AAC.1
MPWLLVARLLASTSTGAPLFLDRRCLVEDRSVFEKTARHKFIKLSFSHPQKSCVRSQASLDEPSGCRCLLTDRKLDLNPGLTDTRERYGH